MKKRKKNQKIQEENGKHLQGPRGAQIPVFIYVGLAIVMVLWLLEASLLPSPWKQQQSYLEPVVFENQRDVAYALRGAPRKGKKNMPGEQQPGFISMTKLVGQVDDPAAKTTKQQLPAAKKKAENLKLRGLDIGGNSALLAQSSSFVCDGRKEIHLDWVNDNYCDCQDGTDETETSACSYTQNDNMMFHCIIARNTKSKILQSEKVFMSRVNDGICDCCDGSDEGGGGGGGGGCEDRCAGLAHAAEVEAARRRQGRGRRAKKPYRGARPPDAAAAAVGGGAGGAFWALAGRCFEDREEGQGAGGAGYVYTVCPYRRVEQQEVRGRRAHGAAVHLGRGMHWEEVNKVLVSTGGDKCPGIGPRKTRIEFSCGLEDKVLEVSEYEMCSYLVSFETPAACIISDDEADTDVDQTLRII